MDVKKIEIKIDWIAKKGGMVLIDTHPEVGIHSLRHDGRLVRDLAEYFSGAQLKSGDSAITSRRSSYRWRAFWDREHQINRKSLHLFSS